MQLDKPIQIGEIKEAVSIDLVSIQNNPASKSLSVTLSLKDAQGKEVEQKTVSFVDTEDTVNTIQGIFDVQDGKVVLKGDEIQEATVVDISTGRSIESSFSGNEITISDKVNRVRVMAKVVIKGSQEYSEIVDGLGIKEDILWQKIKEKLQ